MKAPAHMKLGILTPVPSQNTVKTKYACNNVLLTVITMPYIRSRTYYLSTSCKFIIRKKKLQGKTISYLPLRRTVNLCVGFFVAQGMAILVR